MAAKCCDESPSGLKGRRFFRPASSLVRPAATSSNVGEDAQIPLRLACAEILHTYTLQIERYAPQKVCCRSGSGAGCGANHLACMPGTMLLLKQQQGLRFSNDPFSW